MEQPPTIDSDGYRLLQRSADRSAGWLQRLEEEARAVLSRNPQHPIGLDVLGSTRMLRGDSAGALPLLGRAIELQPRWTTALTHLGDALRALGRLPEAADCYRASIDARPTFAALTGLGQVAMEEKQFDAARICFVRAIELNPGEFAGWCNLSAALQALGDLEHARAAIESALVRAPGHPFALQSLANLLHAEGRLDEALATCESAVRGFEGSDEVLPVAEAPDVYDRVPSTSPELSMSLFLLGVLRAARGDLVGALPLLEWRWGTPQQRVAWKSAPVPLWTGQPLNGRRLLVTFEQGLGDAIQFVRHAIELADEAERVLLAVPEALQDLLSTQHPRMRLAAGNERDHYDFHVPIASLPRMMLQRGALRFEHPPYLRADGVRVDRFASLLPDEGKMRVGIAWKGSAGHPRDHERSSSLDDAMRLVCHAGITAVCLQLGESEVGFANPMPQVRSLADTAAVIASLDAVVAVDTAVAHLSAAMGKPTLVLLNHPADWRWTSFGERTAWYPSMRLLRKGRAERWADLWTRAAVRVLEGFA
jgi:tetratricopeptide (TPR) repeat protein